MQRGVLLSPFLSFALTIVGAPLAAQEPRAAGDPPRVVVEVGARDAIAATRSGLTLSAGQFTVIEFVEAVAAFLCRNYLYDFEELKEAKGFQLQRGLSLDALGAEEILHALLAARGFAALPLDELRGVHQVVALGSPQRAMPVAAVPWRSAEEILRRPRWRELIMTAIHVEHVDAQLLANALRGQFALHGMWQPGVPTACAAGPHMLLLHGYRDQVAQTILVVQHIDRLSASSAEASSATTSSAGASAVPAAAAANGALLRRIEALEREVRELRAQVPRRGG